MIEPETASRSPEGAAPEADEDLVQRILGGEEHLFELVMRRYNQRLYRIARSIVKSDHEAEDVMQEAYVRAYTHLRQFNGSARFSTWLTKIAVHEALARLRHRRRFTDLDIVPAADSSPEGAMSSPSQTPEQRVVALELRALLEASIQALPRALRCAYVLRDIEGLSTSEAAACLGIREDALKARVSRARAALRNELCARAADATGEVFTFHDRRCDRVVAAVWARIRKRAPVSRT